MRIASGEDAVGSRRAGIFLGCEKQFRHRLVKTALKKIRKTDNDQGSADAFAGAERSATPTCSIA